MNVEPLNLGVSISAHSACSSETGRTFRLALRVPQGLDPVERLKAPREIAGQARGKIFISRRETGKETFLISVKYFIAKKGMMVTMGQGFCDRFITSAYLEMSIFRWA